MYRKKYCLIILVILSILYASSLGLSFEPKTLLREYEPILYLYPNVEYDEYVPMNLEPYVEERCSLWRKYVNRPIIQEGRLKLSLLGQPKIGDKEIDWEKFYLWFDEESKPPWSFPTVEPKWGPFDEKLKPYAEAALEEYKKITEKSIIYYGRQTEDAGYTVLQYWFFYAYNPWGAYEFGINTHEGDWEMVSIFLEPQGEELIPRYAAYSAHHDSGDKVTRVWDEVEKISDHPIVYVALGSHANYFDNGDNGKHKIKKSGVPIPGLYDLTTPNGKHIGPGQKIEWDEPFILEDGNLPLWAGNYSGRWGADWKLDDDWPEEPFNLKDGLSGPKGPKFQGAKWAHPADWAGLGSIIDNLIVSGFSHAPSTVTQGQTDVIMEQLDLIVEHGADADGKIIITSLKLDRTGEGDDGDVSLVKLLESDQQTLIDSGIFSDNSITFHFTREITAEEPDIFYISLDIASDAPVGNGVGVKIADSSYITIKSPDTVSTEGFPIESGIAEIQAAGGWPSDPTVNVPICTSAGDQERPQLVSDGAGGAIITWEDERSDSGDIYAQRVDASGAVLWTTDGVPICTAADRQYYSQLVSDGAGGAIIMWQDKRSGNYDIYAQRVDTNGTVLWTTDGVPICTTADDQGYSQLVSDGAGGAIITWWDCRSGNSDIYAQRVDASGVVLWTTDGVPICTTEDGQFDPQVVSDDAGGAIITWQDWRSGNDLDIYAQRVDASGNVLWITDGVRIGTVLCNPGILRPPVSDGARGAIIMWADESSDGIYAQRVDASGAVLWTADGVPICTAEGTRWYSQLVSDDAGGAIITWQDRRDDGYSEDIYAQRVDSSGAVLWTTDGVPICTAEAAQFSPELVNDGANGAIITWHDKRGGNNDIYAQRVDSSGTVLWTTDGIPICTAEYDQVYPQLVSDGAGGAIITWRDERSGDYDIYAQNVQEDGSLGGISGDGGALALAPKIFTKREISPSPDLSLRGRGEHGIPLTTKALQNYPNPFNPDTWIPYQLAVDAPVTITIYNLKGQLIRAIALGDRKVGVYVTKEKAAYWDGRDDAGEKVGSGVYFYTLRMAGEFIATRKMLIVK